MKKGVFICIIVLFLAVLASAALPAYPAVRIAVTIQPYYLMLDELRTGNVEVRRLIDASQNPHTFSPTVQQAKLLYDSDIVLYNGLHLESYLESTLVSIKNGGKTVIAVSDFLSRDRLLAGRHHHDEDLEHGTTPETQPEDSHEEEPGSVEHPSDFNPHIWLDPVFLSVAIIPGLRDLLISVDPGNQAHYLSKSQQMIASIDKLHLEMNTYLSAYSGKTVLMSHPSFAYFFERYGLKLDSIFEGEGDEPSVSEMKEMIDSLKEKKIIALFMEPQQPRRYVEILSKEGKIGIGTLDPLGWSASSIVELLMSNFEEIKRVFP